MLWRAISLAFLLPQQVAPRLLVSVRLEIGLKGWHFQTDDLSDCFGAWRVDHIPLSTNAEGSVHHAFLAVVFLVGLGPLHESVVVDQAFECLGLCLQALVHVHELWHLGSVHGHWSDGECPSTQIWSFHWGLDRQSCIS